MYLKRTTCLLQTPGQSPTKSSPRLEDRKPSKCFQTLTFQRQSKDFLVVISTRFTHSHSTVAEPDPEQGHKPSQRHYRWPLFVIAGVVLGILLAVLWLSFEIRRTERIRQLNSPGGQLTP